MCLKQIMISTAALALLAPTAGHAAKFDVAPGAITISGDIVAKDAIDLPTLLAAQRKAGNPIHTAYLDSPGGLAAPAAIMALALLNADVNTRVRKGATCASACFLAWLGGQHRSFENGSRLGVHRSRFVDGRDDDAGTAFGMRVEAYFDAPESLLLKQQHTPWTDVAWLTADDLGQIVHADPHDKMDAIRHVMADLDVFVQGRKIDEAEAQAAHPAPAPQPVAARPQPAWHALVGQPFTLGGHGEDGQGLTGRIDRIEPVRVEGDGTLYRVNGGKEFVFCSLTRPGIAEREDGKLTVLPLDFGPHADVAESNAWAGYGYLAACHGGGNPWDRAAMARLGYTDAAFSEGEASPLDGL